jgi:phage terminase large subunit
MLIEEHIINPNQSSVCIREVQKSIKMSVKRLLEMKIETMGVGSYFEVQESQIKSRKGTGTIIFQGMQNHTADSIKSLEGYDRAWCEEAQSLSQRSIDLLRPTLRKPGSEIWASWNPYLNTDPIDVLLRGDNLPPGSTVLQVNYNDNPWLPDVLREEMEYDKRRDPDKYAHVWLGEYAGNTAARVFSNWSIEEFETVPEAEKWPVIADSARPETISHMKRHGFPKLMAAVKGPGSLEDGVEWLKTYDITVHPRCKHVIDELTLYSYKVDQTTGGVLPVLEDKNNHVIDALAQIRLRRYTSSSAQTGQSTSRSHSQ